MNTSRIVVPTIALGAGGIAAYLASGSDNRPLAAVPAAQLQTVDVLVARSGIGQSVKPEDMQWQSWPAASASSTIRRDERHDATTQRPRQSGTLSLALRSIIDVNMVENRTDDQAAKRGESVNMVRYGIPSSTTTQK
jgi:Flp pilus assembly protein CpaB